MKSLKFLTLAIFFIHVHTAIAQHRDSKPRIIVSTDIGGTDYDDFQSMVHLFVYADKIELEGIIASPYGEGRKSDILKVINAYEKDYLNLKTYSNDYPSPQYLRKITTQGAKDLPSIKGYATPTDGSKWIVECARKQDSRPLNILIWGGIEDLAQALHDAPDILPKLRVYYIGGPNKKWSVNAYQYVVDNFKNLWLIEANASYFGWFVGGNQEGDYSNRDFVEKHIKDKGALGKYFYNIGEKMKMGDTPSLTYFFGEKPNDPTLPNWGGQFVRAWDRPYKEFNRITTKKDSLEEYGVLKLCLKFSETVVKPYAKLKVTNQLLEGYIEDNTVTFLFSPKTSAEWDYVIESNIPSLNNLKGGLVSYLTPPSNINKASSHYPNWWVDDPSPELMEGKFIGAKTISKWRTDFLDDFAQRMNRCHIPKK